MKMQKVQVMMEVPKEGKEVVDFIAKIITDLKMKKSIAEIAGGSLPSLMVAVEGFNMLGEEFMSDGQDEMVGYLVQQVMSALKAMPAVVPPVTPAA